MCPGNTSSHTISGGFEAVCYRIGDFGCRAGCCRDSNLMNFRFEKIWIYRQLVPHNVCQHSIRALLKAAIHFPQCWYYQSDKLSLITVSACCGKHQLAAIGNAAWWKVNISNRDSRLPMLIVVLEKSVLGNDQSKASKRLSLKFEKLSVVGTRFHLSYT